MKRNRKVKLSLYITIIGLLFLVVGSSFAVLQNTTTSTKKQIVYVGGVKLTLNEPSTGINLTGLNSMTDAEGFAQTNYYEFSISNTGDANAEFSLLLVDDPLHTNALSDNTVKVGLEINGETEEIVNLGEANKIINENMILKGETINYKLRIWLDANAISQLTDIPSEGSANYYKLKIEALQYLGEIITPDYCFTFNQGSITAYNCYEGNSYNYPVITEVVVPNVINNIEVRSLGTSAFYNKNLNSIILPEFLTNLGESCLRANKLTSIILPNSITTIEESAFEGNFLSSIDLPNSLITIGDYAFEFNHITNLEIPSSVTSIGTGAFHYNNLHNVIIPSDSNLTATTGIGAYAFSTNNLVEDNDEDDTRMVWPNNPNLTTIYNNSSKTFKWYYIIQGRNNSTATTYNFATGTVPSYTSGTTIYNAVTITTSS